MGLGDYLVLLDWTGLSDQNRQTRHDAVESGDPV